MKFTDTFFSQENRFSIGQTEPEKKYYLSIPVSNQFADYEEYYEIDLVLYQDFLSHPDAALPFVIKCRRREMDHLLIVKPGKNRGTAT